MGRGHPFLLPVLLPVGASFVLLLALPASAQADTPCRRVKLVERAGLPEALREAAHVLRTELDSLSSEDCVDITLVLEAAGTRGRLVAITRDGQHTEREVEEPSSLRALAIGLIAAPTPEPAPPMSNDDPLRPSAAERPPKDTEPVAEPEPARRATKMSPRDRSLHFVLGAETGVRMGEPTRVAMSEVVLRAHVSARDWLVGINARYAPFGARVGGSKVPGFTYSEAGMGIDLGRRVRLGLGALDLFVSPGVAITTMVGDVPDDDVGGTDYDVRVSGAARFLFPFAGSWRPSATLDAAVSPLSLGSPKSLDPVLPFLPTWSIGLRVGAAGDL